MLGAKAQKDAFPKAIYPGEIPGSIPIAFRYSGFASYNSKQPYACCSSRLTSRKPTCLLPTPSRSSARAVFGQNISWWIDDDISSRWLRGRGGLGDGYMKFNDLGHYFGLPKDTLNVRFGQFELDLPFTQARTINLTNYDIYRRSRHGRGPGWAPQ